MYLTSFAVAVFFVAYEYDFQFCDFKCALFPMLPATSEDACFSRFTSRVEDFSSSHGSFLLLLAAIRYLEGEGICRSFDNTPNHRRNHLA